MTVEINKTAEMGPASDPAPQTGGDGPAQQEQEQAIAAQQAESEPAADLTTLKKQAEDRIDAFMVKVGYNPPDRTDEAGWFCHNCGIPFPPRPG